MKNGVPFHTAFDAPADYVPDDQFKNALIIVLGELSGGEWDWATMSWRKG